jgi:cell division protein ZapA
VQKIKLTIANRVYPLSVSSIEEEQVLREAVKKIEGMIQHFEKNYAVNDKQDVLAMCALQLVAQAARDNRSDALTNKKIGSRIDALNQELVSLLSS